MRRKLVIGNWKMHGSRQMCESLAKGVAESVADVSSAGICVCPPALYVNQVADILADSQVAVGSQNVCGEAAGSGAYTGEISAEMLADSGCAYTLVGHSERREYYGEADEILAAKCQNLLEKNVTPVLCVGENLEQRDAGNAMQVVSAQVEAIIDELGIDAFAKLVVAYEPIWAIGTGRTATPEQAQEVHAAIRACVASHSASVAEALQILYGGSVKGANAAELFAMEDIDGALVGGAALKAEEFSNICKAAE